MTQKVVVEPLLPLARRRQAEAPQAPTARRRADFIFEPNKRALLERLVPMYVEISHLPRAAREPGELLRRADDGDGRGDEQREGDDRAAHARSTTARARRRSPRS